MFIAHCTFLISHCPLLIAPCSLLFTWPGGMHEAIESAALAVWQELACQIETTSPKSQITSCRSQTPSKSPPAPPRIPPGRLKMAIRSIFVIFISLGTGRAKCKKNMSPGTGCEFASKLQASRCLFHNFHALTHFAHHIFWKMCFLPTRGAHFCKTALSTFDQNYHFFDPQTASKTSLFVIFACSCRSVARSVRFLFAPCALQKQPVPRLPCTFRLQCPVSKNDCMQHTYIFMNFVCHLLFSLSFSCFPHPPLPFFAYFL